jgi:ligand-binding sensor domain-containing protein
VANVVDAVAVAAARTALLLAFAFATPAFAAIRAEPGPPETPRPTPSFDTWREIGTREGLPQSTVYAMAQDRDGYIWAGTEDGVARYDGRRWQRIEIPGVGNAPPHGQALAATEDGAVWLGTDIRGLLRWNGTAMEPFGASRGLSVREIRGIVRDGMFVVLV